MAKIIEAKVRHSETKFMRVIAEEVSLDDFREIVRRTKEMALAGDAAARLFITAYCCGMPKGTAPKLSLLDGIDKDDEFMRSLTGGVL